MADASSSSASLSHSSTSNNSVTITGNVELTDNSRNSETRSTPESTLPAVPAVSPIGQ